MRYVILCLFAWVFAAPGFAHTLSKPTESALLKMQQGYISDAIKQIKEAASVNDLVAQYYLGQCYQHGIGMAVDETAAFRMYRRAAERGLPIAMEQLAKCYHDGIGVEINKARCREWEARYRKKQNEQSIPDIVELYRIGIAQQGYATLNATENAIDSVAPTVAVTTQPKVTSIQVLPSGEESVRMPPMPDEALSAQSDVDVDFQSTETVHDDVFALIIANEDYQDVANVPNALNDGEIVAQYCQKALGIPSANVRLVKNATFNNIKRELNLMSQIAAAYGGKASFIVYYAGHGIPDEKTGGAYLMPIDGFGTDTSTCYSLAEFYSTLGDMPSKKTVVLLDACFSGSGRGDGMLASARGVAIKAKPCAPSGNMVVLSASQGDESAYPYNEQKHGLFTYYLLKKLKESNGDVTVGELIAYITENVLKKSLVVNGKSQTPTANPSPIIGSTWQNWKLN